MFISNYTGMVTALAVQRALSAEITSLEDGLTKGYSFCGWATFEGTLVAVFPKLQGKYVGIPFSSSINPLIAMDNGECDAAILDADAWATAGRGDYSSADSGARYANWPAGVCANIHHRHVCVHYFLPLLCPCTNT